MANLGISNASYYADTSISRLNRQVTESVDKVSSNKANITNGDKTSLVSMDNAFKLDLAATNAAVKNMSVAQAYLSTAISTLDNASAILMKIHELAVLGANGSNSDADNAALNIESEALIDAFHKSMTVAQFKGKEVFMDEPNTLSSASGGRSSSVEFGVGKVDYDVLYDYTNPGLTSLSSGVKYEIRRDLSDLEKAAILSRSSNLTENQLIKGFQFTTDLAPSNNIGDGTIQVHPMGKGVLDYNKGDGAVQLDANASANGITADFKKGFVDIQVTENYELSDTLSLKSAGDITITDGVVFYTDRDLKNDDGTPNVQTVEIGAVDKIKNGQNGTTLRINLHEDATVPGSSDLDNGSFTNVRSDIVRYDPILGPLIAKTEARTGVISGLELADNTAINLVANIANPTHSNVTLAYKVGQNGLGEGPVRVNLLTADVGGVETIQQMQIIDGGKKFQANEIMVVGANAGDITDTELTITAVEDKVHTLTDPKTRTVGTGQFQQQTVTKRDIVGYGPDKINPDTGARTQGDPIYGDPYDVVQNVEITTQVYDGEQIQYLERAVIGYNPVTEDRVADWTVYENRVFFGQDFEILDSLDGTRIQTDPAAGTVEPAANTHRKTLVPTPELNEMAVPVYEPYTSPFSGQTATPTENVKNKDNLGASANGFDVSREAYGNNDFRLELDTGALTFNQNAGFGILHGPAAVSDKFEAKAGQFLKLNYDAQKLPAGDDYHVAGYIYEVDANGDAIRDNGKARITMAFSDTGTDGSGRASVLVDKTSDYRFVFIGGTFDKTGFLESGARMFIDNIVAENPYTIGNGAINNLLKAVHFENNANSANPSKTLVVTASNKDGTAVLTDDALINMTGFATTVEPNGPYMLAPTLNFTTQPSEGGTGSAVVLTKKIEVVQDRLNLARTQASSQVAALEEAIDSTTDLRSQFALGSGTLSDLNFSIETVNLTRRQMQQDVATSVLAQANKTQSSLVSLVDGSYRTYLNAQFSHLK